jgi:hypothetical protein
MKWWQLIEIILERTAVGTGVGAGIGAAAGAGIGAADVAKSGTVIGAGAGISAGGGIGGKVGTIIGAGTGLVVGLIEVIVVCCHGPTKLLEKEGNQIKDGDYTDLTKEHVVRSNDQYVRQQGTGVCYLIAPIISMIEKEYGESLSDCIKQCFVRAC